MADTVSGYMAAIAVLSLDSAGCTYCGLPAEHYDHIVPRSYETNKRGYFTSKRELVVPACAECNIALGDRWLPTVAGRAEWLLERFRHKYHQDLRLPKWDKYDLDELRPGAFRTDTELVSARRDVARAREAHMRVIAQAGSALTALDVWEALDAAERQGR